MIGRADKIFLFLSVGYNELSSTKFICVQVYPYIRFEQNCLRMVPYNLYKEKG